MSHNLLGRSRRPHLRSAVVLVAALALASGLSAVAVATHGLRAPANAHGVSAAAATQADAPARVSDPFSGATPYLNPDYVAEVKAQASADGSSAEAAVANSQTAIWMDHIGAITGDNGHMGLQAQLDNAASQASPSSPVVVEIVIYDLPGRDCAALASNGEIPATAAGLTEYESQYIDPIASIEGSPSYSNLRIVNIIEPDSLPNVVTNQSIPACQTATPFYEQGIEHALNKLHAIGNTYNYMDIAHSAWLGWSSNFQPAVEEFAKVAQATTAGFASVDGFISNTANYTPTTEPFMTATESVGGTPVDQASFYQFDPYIDELNYDQAMRSALISAGFSSNIGMLIDTSRNGWGGPGRPAGPGSSTDVNTFVSQSKTDQRDFRGEWCNIKNAGIGARPQDNPAPGIQAYVWIKPPGESDGTYPAFSGSGDPHCDPNGSYTDGNGKSYPDDAIPDSPPAGQWFPTAFQQLVANADPAISAAGATASPPTPTPTATATNAPAQTMLSGSQTAMTADGNYVIQNNEWNSGAAESITSDLGEDFTVARSSISNATNGAPGGYPSIYQGCHWGACSGGNLATHPVQGGTGVTSSWSTTQPADSNVYDVAYDNWFNSTPTTSGQPDCAELMVWLNHNGPVQPFGSDVGAATVDGTSYHVWFGTQAWPTISYVMTNPATSVSNLNIGDLAADAVSRGFMPASCFLISVEAGFELWQGGQGLATNSFSVSSPG
jgi:cellulose 1,4-beta-cellobiosidase